MSSLRIRRHHPRHDRRLAEVGQWLGDRLEGDAGFRAAGDGGYAAVLTALLLVPLCIFVAFAVDLGAWYAQAAKAQRAADAAAMAGVVWLPDQGAAIAASNQALSRNWYDKNVAAPSCGANAGGITVSCGVSAANSLYWAVSVRSNAPVVFGKVAGLNNVSIGRSATAAFNPPIPLGSPDPSFGNQLPAGCTDPAKGLPSAAACSAANSSNVANVWATINGPYETHANGDPFATRCWGDNDTSDLTGGTCSSPAKLGGGSPPTNPAPPNGDARWNPYFKPDGYIFGIDAKAPGTYTVELYDAAFDPRGNNTTETGDNSPKSGEAGPITDFQLYKFSGSAYQYNANPGNEQPGCRLTANPGTTASPTIYKNTWKTLCTFSVGTPGLYPLRVRVDNIAGVCTFTNVWSPSGCKGAGQNSFSIRASGPSVQVYALDYLPVYSNFSGFTSSFYLADVGPQNAGKTIVIDMYDPGDGGCVLSGDNACQFNMSIVGPDAAGNPNYQPTCDWRRSDIQGGPANLVLGAQSPCMIVTRSNGTSRFNNEWLRILIKLPNNYTCPGANKCWWKVNYNFNAAAGHPGQPTDHTTWTLNVVGNPVHLVS